MSAGRDPGPVRPDHYGPGSPETAQRKASMREVARYAGVAMSSVSRVLSGHADVSPQMRKRVLEAVEVLGYEPDMLARSLRRRETRTVGFVVGDISNPVFAGIFEGVEGRLREAGYSLLAANSAGDPARDAEQIGLLEQRRVDGLILSLVDDTHPPTIDRLRHTQCPVVLLDRDLPLGLRASRVLSDHAGGMADAVRHLLDLGHRRIALLLGQSMRPSIERRAGFERAFAERGLAPTYAIRAGRLSVEHGVTATRELLDLAEPPTAIIAGGNQLMIGALKVIAGRGIELGRDLSFVGCDEVSIADLYRPSIAVIRRDTVELGRAAAELLVRRLQGEQEVSEVVLPTEFVARASCAAPAGASA